MELAAENDVVCINVSGLRFFVYSALFEKTKMRVPFTLFQKRVLRFLNVALSQLTPNSWGFNNNFEIVMKALGWACRAKIFFLLFDVF